MEDRILEVMKCEVFGYPLSSYLLFFLAAHLAKLSALTVFALCLAVLRSEWLRCLLLYYSLVLWCAHLHASATTASAAQLGLFVSAFLSATTASLLCVAGVYSGGNY